MSALGGDDVERFCAVVTRRLGFRIDDARLDALADVLMRMAAKERTPRSLLTRLEAGAHDDLRALAEAVTVPETYFFRNVDQFRAFRELVVPGRLAARGPARELRVLSAGCASGEEAYSIAIALRELGVAPSIPTTIMGTDVNPAVLAKAASGRYSPWALRETPAEARGRWFTRDGRDFVLADEVRASVTFHEHNLLDPEPWPVGSFDVVFWRNVMMYFTPEAASRVITSLTRSLVPGGYLFLGHAETLRGISNEFHLRSSHDTFYYQRKEHPDEVGTSWEPVLVPSPSPPSIVTASVDSPPSTRHGADSWVEIIDQAARRIQALAEAPTSSRRGVEEARDARVDPPPSVGDAPSKEGES